MSSPLIDEGVGALRAGDAATARRVFELAVADAESGRALEGLAEALYLQQEYSAAAGHYERACHAYRRERDIMAAGRAARIVGLIGGNVLALVGDAGYNKDFITAQGITDAFRDAELCATALDQTLSGACPFEVAMARYQHTRDQLVLPMYEFTTQLATLEPSPPELAALLAAVHGTPQRWTPSRGSMPG